MDIRAAVRAAIWTVFSVIKESSDICGTVSVGLQGYSLLLLIDRKWPNQLLCKLDKVFLLKNNWSPIYQNSSDNLIKKPIRFQSWYCIFNKKRRRPLKDYVLSTQEQYQFHLSPIRHGGRGLLLIPCKFWIEFFSWHGGHCSLLSNRLTLNHFVCYVFWKALQILYCIRISFKTAQPTETLTHLKLSKQTNKQTNKQKILYLKE